MKNKIITILFCLFSFLLTSQPILTIDKTTYNFDTIPFASNGECVFKYRNTGNKPLIITHGQTSGGGLVWVMQKTDTVYPKASGTFKFKYDTKRVGAFSKTGNIYSNASNGTITILVKGFVKAIPIAYVQKNNHDFGSIVSGTKLKWEFDIENHGTAPLIVSKIEQPKGCVANLSKDTIESQASQLSMNIDTRNMSGILNKTWKVYTNADLKAIEFTVKANIQFSPLKIDSIYPYKKGSRIFSIQFNNTSADTLELYFAESEIISVNSNMNVPKVTMLKIKTSKVEGPYDDIQLILPHEKGELSYEYDHFFMNQADEQEKEITFSLRTRNKKTKYKNVAYIKF